MSSEKAQVVSWELIGPQIVSLFRGALLNTTSYISAVPTSIIDAVVGIPSWTHDSTVSSTAAPSELAE